MKPILFSTLMVKAIMDGQKTQTRRVIKFPKGRTPHWYHGPNEEGLHDFMFGAIDPENRMAIDWSEFVIAPFAVGDELWVRETFAVDPCLPDCAGHEDENECPFNQVGDKCYKYQAQYTEPVPKIGWKPSIHMPSEAARIFLMVTDVRAEQLQDISEDDMIAEGIMDADDYATKSPPDEYPEHDPRYKGWIGWNRVLFESLWNEFAKQGTRWRDNPWVWVISFERINTQVMMKN